jgi:hypothetical protein
MQSTDYRSRRGPVPQRWRIRTGAKGKVIDPLIEATVAVICGPQTD